MSVLFISDLHLEDSQPRRTQWLLSFLSGVARDAQSVYILGDLFEFWIGDDAPTQTAGQVARAIRGLVDSGVPCYFMHGNRDFMIGEAYAASAGMELLPETAVVDLYGLPTLIMHGDTLCTDDVEYQAIRRQTRDPAWQAGVLAMSIDERIEMARHARDASMKHTGTVAMEIMDVNPKAVDNAFRKFEVTRMIHGHTHRPAVHRTEIDGRKAERIVLADWYDNGTYLEVSADGCRSRKI
jgi:UDP-2,3-diacylglucosamine hydrolase